MATQQEAKGASHPWSELRIPSSLSSQLDTQITFAFQLSLTLFLSRTCSYTHNFFLLKIILFLLFYIYLYPIILIYYEHYNHAFSCPPKPSLFPGASPKASDLHVPQTLNPSNPPPQQHQLMHFFFLSNQTER